MKMIICSPSRQRGLFLLTLPLIAASLLAVTMLPSAASGKPTPMSASSKVPPTVSLPYTFECPHCNMKITIKTPADWKKDCLTCACGTTNLGCYREKKK